MHRFVIVLMKIGLVEKTGAVLLLSTFFKLNVACYGFKNLRTF